MIINLEKLTIPNDVLFAKKTEIPHNAIKTKYNFRTRLFLQRAIKFSEISNGLLKTYNPIIIFKIDK